MHANSTRTCLFLLIGFYCLPAMPHGGFYSHLSSADKKSITDSSHYQFNDNPSTCTQCHDAPRTCNGCHAHGVHSDEIKDDINIIAKTDKTHYTAGETITVTVTGGYKPENGWIRMSLYTVNGVLLAKSSGPCDQAGTDDNGCGGGADYPITLTTIAESGMTELRAAWFGHSFDVAGSAFGEGVTNTANEKGVGELINASQFDTIQFLGWRISDVVDHHGEQIVATNVFTVGAIGEAPGNPGGNAVPGQNANGTTTGRKRGGGGIGWEWLLLAAVYTLRRTKRT